MIRNLLRTLAIAAGIGVALAVVPAALAAAVIASDAPTEYKVGALWFLACALVVSAGAALALAVSRWRARRAEARHQVTRALLHTAMNTRPQQAPRTRPGALYVASSRTTRDDTAQLPAVPAEPDFTPAGIWDNPREARALHHQVFEVVADRALQTLLDQIDDLPGLDDDRREWLRAQALHGVPARTLLDATWWAAVDRRRKPKPKPKPYPNGGR